MIDPINTPEQGGISVDTAHIFPIIKRWLYSEKDIFLREIVSNASDAITKMNRLCSLGEAECTDKYKICVRVDATAGTLTVEDNGIGMSADELKRYICQIALSGALEFIDKYEGNTDSNQSSGIIGHFGLGFYSSFMIADKVEIITKSYTDSPAVHWICSDDGNYEISSSDRDERGTSVIMHVTDDEKDSLSINKIRTLLDKY
jgi:molecular chaperone HtpG